MKLQKKILKSFFVIIFLCLLTLLTNELLQMQINYMNEDIQKEQNKLILIQRLNYLGVYADDKGWYLISGNVEDSQKHLLKYQETIQSANKELERLIRVSNTSEEKIDIQNFEHAWKIYLESNDASFQVFEKGELEKARNLYSELPFDQTIKTLVSYKEREKSLVAEKLKSVAVRKTIILWINVASIFFFIIVCIGLSWTISAKVKLDEYIELQKQFFQNTSHELKTPLMSIQGYAEGILDGTFQGNRLNTALEIIIKESKRLKKVVTEMILLNKLEYEESVYDFQKILVEELVEEAVYRVAPLMKEKAIMLDLRSHFFSSISPMINVDPEKWLQALINILSNAIRYAENRIDIDLSIISEEVQIEIRDDGKGIPKEILSYLFQRFTKGEDGDTGLGLAISRAIIENCGGKIEVMNQDKGGALFRIRISKVN